MNGNGDNADFVYKIERPSLLYFQKILGKKNSKMLSLDTLKVRREKLALKFGLNCVENPKTKKLFNLKPKRHKSHTQKACCNRKEYKFNIIKTNTARLARSSVPFLQRLLNKNANGTK